MNTYSVSMKSPTSSDRPADNTDNDKEESARLGLPSSSLTPDSSVLMAHKDVAPHTKGRTNHVQTSAEPAKENGMKREKKKNDNVPTTVVCVKGGGSSQQQSKDQVLRPHLGFCFAHFVLYLSCVALLNEN